MSDTMKGFNFFLNSSSKEIQEKDNPSLEYIIIQNDFLHKRVKELEEQNQELTKEKEEFEHDNERYESRFTALRGITFNECEMSKLLEKVVKGYNETIEEHKNIEKEYYKIMQSNYKIVGLFQILNYLIIMLGFYIPEVMFYLLGIFVIGYNTILSKDINKRAIKVKLDTYYEQREKEYTKLRKNQDYISTMLDNI